ncbi:chaperone-modulator protein CbpM [Legionella massiliensis]|uniref:Chaperone-modulator protein CbpM n=1 Tax=Legionella massiliensis TaxID=1034943 RepID=A0A078KX44_9GAMM|nr:chaperone modulator CbpM [Legionella massiliensis]CDZ77536.1 chaperone-modulator protein CbpM [Legionella massiliensis]CEE13274.1 Chaperone modulatory protein CbpM [Legionella massiliensis]
MSEYKNKSEALECEQWFYLSLTEVTTSFGVSKDTIIEIIDEGIISVQEDDRQQLRFDSEALRRIRTVLRLNHDLGVNLAGAGLALELLRKIEHLEALLNEGMEKP